jgi:S1-C subfamily serine protease
LRVVEVKPDSSAAKAGLAVGDLITAVNNRQTVKAEDIKIALGAALDKPLRVEVTRKGEAVTLEAAKP